MRVALLCHANTRPQVSCYSVAIAARDVCIIERNVAGYIPLMMMMIAVVVDDDDDEKGIQSHSTNYL